MTLFKIIDPADEAAIFELLGRSVTDGNGRYVITKFETGFVTDGESATYSIVAKLVSMVEIQGIADLPPHVITKMYPPAGSIEGVFQGFTEVARKESK